MDISGVTNSAQKTDSAAKKPPRNDMDKDAFLRLLVAQMRYQDPLKPMEDKEFVAQLAQFSALEQMMNVGLAANLNYGVGILGKQVTGVDADGVPVTGTATSVRLRDGKPIVTLKPKEGDDVEVELGRISKVDNQPPVSGQ